MERLKLLQIFQLNFKLAFGSNKAYFSNDFFGVVFVSLKKQSMFYDTFSCLEQYLHMRLVAIFGAGFNFIIFFCAIRSYKKFITLCQAFPSYPFLRQNLCLYFTFSPILTRLCIKK